MGAASECCPICGGAGAVVHRLRGSPVAACGGCSLVWCTSLPGVGADSAGANSVQTDEGYTAGLLTDHPAKRARYRLLAEGRYAQYSRRLGRDRFRLLEIGCGVAGMRERFVELGVDYVGIDIDARVVEAACRRGAAAAVVRRLDFLELPETEGPFDVICASQVLEHIRVPAAFVAKVHRMLSPGGLFHCDVPNHQALAGWPSRVLPWTPRRFGGITYPHHAFSYTDGALRRTLQDRFELETLTATPLHPVWGQAGLPGLAARAYFRASELLGARSLLVAIGRAR